MKFVNASNLITHRGPIQHNIGDLHFPLSNPPYCFFALEDACQWPIRDDPNSMRLEVVLELSSRHEDYIEKLLYLWVPCLSIFQDLANKVHWLFLDFSSSPWPFNGEQC
jgi:hypothetical protein